MRKSVAILGIIALLLLSACRVPGGEGGGASASPPPPKTTPAVRETPSVPPESSPPPSAESPDMIAPPALPTAEELSALALEWCEIYRNRFAGYDVFQIKGTIDAVPSDALLFGGSETYWYADYDGGMTQVPFTASDGADGTVRFLPSTGGENDGLNAAAQLLGQRGEDLILVDRARMLEEVSQRIGTLAEEGATEAAALSYFLKAVQYLPALGENMMYCVNVDDSGYILMLHNGVYRLQRMIAMVEYAQTPQFQARVAFDRATEAALWFGALPLPCSETETVQMDGATYYKVVAPEIDSMVALRTYLKSLFSDEVVDKLLRQEQGSESTRYAEINGMLYAVPAELAGTPSTGESVLSITQTGVSRVDVTVSVKALDPNPDNAAEEKTYVFPYEQVGDKWIFTEFELINQNVRQEMPA